MALLMVLEYLDISGANGTVPDAFITSGDGILDTSSPIVPTHMYI